MPITRRGIVVVAFDLADGEASRRLTAWDELRTAYGSGVEVVAGLDGQRS